MATIIADPTGNAMSGNDLLHDISVTTSGTLQSAELRSLIGLDYGGDRDAWLTWWKRDQQSGAMCRNGKRNFLYRGRVGDDRGQPPGFPPEQVRATFAAYAEHRKEPVVSFYFSQFRPGVSRRFAIYTNPNASAPDAASNAVSPPTAGRYRVQLTWNPDAAPDKLLLAEATPAAGCGV